MPLLLAPILVILYALGVYHWQLGVGHVSVKTPWFVWDESTPVVLLYVFVIGLTLIYTGVFCSWLLRLPSLWRRWRFDRLLHKAIIFYLFGLSEKALKQTEKCLQLQPRNAISTYLKGRILDTLGRKTEATVAFTSIKKHPLLKYHGLILLLKNDLPQRHHALKAAFKLLPQSPFLHELLATQKSYITKIENLVDYSRYKCHDRGEIYALKGVLTKNPKWFKKAWSYDCENLAIFQKYFQSAVSHKHALKIAQKAYRKYPHPVIMHEILRLKNITDPLEQYVYIQKQGANSAEMSFLLARLHRLMAKH